MNGCNSFRRRLLLTSGAAVTIGTLPLRSHSATADVKAGIAREAFIWGLPLVLTGRYLELAAKVGTPFNDFRLSPDLSSPTTHAAGPNVDTLYGYAWLDLRSEPQVLTTPDTQDRYFSIQLLDTYGNSFAYVGRRATGTHAGRFAITSPAFKGTLPSGLTEIRAPTDKVLALVRTLVRGQADLSAARAVHRSYELGPLSAWPKGRRAGKFQEDSVNVFPFIDLSNAGPAYFDELNDLLTQFPPLQSDAAHLARFAPIGVGLARPISGDPSLRPVLAEAVSAGYAAVRKSDFSISDNGWRTNLDIRPFITDPLERAANNVYGPGAHINKEALYFLLRSGPDGAPLSGQQRYHLRFPAGQTPPVDAFWSLTVYDADTFFLTENPIHRYAITDRTEGLTRGADGALEISLQHEPPVDPGANWLPIPPGRFQLILRTYQPRTAILDRSYRLPPLQIA